MSGVGLSFLVHYFSFMATLGVLTFDISYVDLAAHHSYAGRFKFLTFISFLVDLVYYNMAAIIDFLVWTRGRESPLWKSIRDFLFTTLVFPLATFVCVMFWAIYLHDTNSLRDAEEMKVIPKWFDHGYHTLPIVLVFLQAYLIEHTQPRKRMAFLMLLISDSLYIAWLFWIAHRANFWVYPFLSRMSFTGVLLFVTISVAISFAFYFVGRKFIDIVWTKAKNKTR